MRQVKPIEFLAPVNGSRTPIIVGECNGLCVSRATGETRPVSRVRVNPKVDPGNSLLGPLDGWKSASHKSGRIKLPRYGVGGSHDRGPV